MGDSPTCQNLNKPPALILAEQIPLLTEEIAGVARPITAGFTCSLPDIGNAVNLKGSAILPCDRERHNLTFGVGI